MIEPAIDSQKFSLKNYINQTRLGFSQLFRNKYVSRLSLYYTLVAGITWSCLFYFNQPFAYDLGFSEIGVAQLFAVITLITTLFIYFLTKKNPRFLNRGTVFIAFPLLMIISFLPSVFANKFSGFFILLGISLAGSARFSILDRFTNAEYDSKYRATAVSSLNMLVSLFYIILVGISGKLQDVYNTKLVFTLLGVISIAIIPVAINLIKHYRQNSQTSNETG
jgi:predicted MFS family arabinose efflux permease